MSKTFERSHRARRVGGLRAIDVMHAGVISCPPGTSLRAVSRMMASYRVHAIAVHADEDEGLPGGGEWGIVTDTDLVGAALHDDLDQLTACRLAVTPALTVATVDPLERAMRLMVEHDATHLIVVERHSGRPVGVLSTLDVARALAAGV